VGEGMMLIVLLVILWISTGIIGGGVVLLTKFDMTINDALLIVLCGTIIGPICPLMIGVSILATNPPKSIIVKRFGSRNNTK
jgi:hypothetical protein